MNIYENDDDTRLGYCCICQEHTPQYVETYVREYLPFEPANPTVSRYYKEYYPAWECSKCCNHVADLPKPELI